MLLPAILIQTFFVAAALALPSNKERLETRVARRSGHAHLSRPRVTNDTHVQYSQNWAGIVLTAPKGTWKSVTGTFTVPTPRTPSGSALTGTYAASAWVGIDGDTCGTAILQTGVDFTVSSGRVSFDGWYEWYPDYAYDFAGLSFSAGDSVTLTVTATTPTSGTATIKNNSKGTSATKQLAAEPAALCEQDAEWIVEDFEEGSSLVPFANFGTITWTNAYATTNNGTVVSVSTSGETVTISYV